MSNTTRAQLLELLDDLELDTRLATTREQLIRATQRHLKLKRLLEEPTEADNKTNKTNT